MRSSHSSRPASVYPGFIAAAQAQPGALTKSQSDALNAYNKAVDDFRSVLRQRRAQINAKQLPNLPGQALYLARNAMMSTYKDLTDALPSKIGRPNKFGIPPAYFDAGNEPLIDEYLAIFKVMQAPPANAQYSDTPFHDVADLGTAIARAKGLDAGQCRSRRPHQPGAVLCRDQRQSEHGQCALEQVQGKLADRDVRGPDRSTEMGRDQAVDRGLCACASSRATTRKRRGSAISTAATITGPRCATG